MSVEFHARVFRNGRSRAVRIPAGIDLPGDEMIFRQDRGRVTIEPKAQRRSLAELFASWEPLPPEDRFDDDISDTSPEPIE